MLPWNEPILDTFRRDALPHAFLIHGPRGVGKLALAERAVQLMLCEAPESASRPCGACEGCRWYAAGSHPDFRRLEPEALAQQRPNAQAETPPEEAGATPGRRAKPSTVIKIEQVRELADFLNVGSHRGRRRVTLVHPAEEMNANAANALLKGLEEPPASALFLLVSHRPARLLPTIRSRCVAVPVGLPSRSDALHWLAAQGVEDAERWLAYAGGAPLRACAYAQEAETVDRLLRGISAGGTMLVDDREEVEALAEALQKIALDGALMAFGLPGRYRAGNAAPGPAQARAWLSFARQMGRNRALSRHPLNTRLFAAEMLAAMPREANSP